MININRTPERGKTAVTQSMNASFNGAAYLVERMNIYSIIAQVLETSASLAGTLKLQVSNNAFTDNASFEENSNAVWDDLPSSSYTLTAGNDVWSWNVADVGYEAVRIVWTRTSGQGTIAPYFLAKCEG